MARNIIVKGHVAGVVNALTNDGEPVCHLLLEDTPAGDALAKALTLTGRIYDNADRGPLGDWTAVPGKYKRKDGAPLHVFLGDDPKVPLIKEEV
jgi:hypothetical protein